MINSNIPGAYDAGQDDLGFTSVLVELQTNPPNGVPNPQSYHNPSFPKRKIGEVILACLFPLGMTTYQPMSQALVHNTKPQPIQWQSFITSIDPGNVADPYNETPLNDWGLAQASQT